MNHKISICIIFLLLIIITIIVFGTSLGKKTTLIESEQNTVAETQKLMETINNIKKSDTYTKNTIKYIVKYIDKKIVVFASDGSSVYFETDLNYDGLPNEIKLQLIEGISFADDKGLYDFLEGYSS